MKIYLDFDGTVVEHEYPRIGNFNKGCDEVIKKLSQAGHEIILNTYRANCNDGTLEKAVEYLRLKNLGDCIASVESKKITPKVWDWNIHLENKIIYIDDICEGIPLKSIEQYRFGIVDWQKVDEELKEHGIYYSV